MLASAVSRRLQLAAFLAPLLAATHGFAQVGVGERARPALSRVGVASPARTGAVGLAVSVLGGVSEALAENDGAHARAALSAAAALNASRWLDFAARIEGRYDRHPADEHGADDGLLFQPELSTRLSFRFGALGLGLEAAAWLPAGSGVASSASALSADGRLLLSHQAGNLVVAGYAGYRLDRSAETVADVTRLRFGDRSALGASDFDAALVGLGLGYLADKTLLFGETSADILLGAPSFLESPLRLAVGARHPFGPIGLSGELALQVALSQRPALDPGSPLLPLEPRALLSLGLRYELGRVPPQAPPPQPTAMANPPAAPPPAPKPSRVTLSLLDDQGQPLRQATVTLEQGEQKTPLSETEPGQYRVDSPTPGRALLRIEAPGFKSVERTVEIGQGVPLKLDVKAEQALPAGQVRGLVRSFNGKALAASIRVEPSGAQTRTDADGFFQLDVPPGEYEVTIQAPGYAPQRRKAKVEQQGVVIVNADLSKAP